MNKSIIIALIIIILIILIVSTIFVIKNSMNFIFDYEWVNKDFQENSLNMKFVKFQKKKNRLWINFYDKDNKLLYSMSSDYKSRYNKIYISNFEIIVDGKSDKKPVEGQKGIIKKISDNKISFININSDDYSKTEKMILYKKK